VCQHVGGRGAKAGGTRVFLPQGLGKAQQRIHLRFGGCKDQCGRDMDQIASWAQ